MRVINDADMQGFGAIEGRGLEMVITLGTGFGSALFMDGELAPHLEIAHLPFRNDKTYDQQIGEKARKKVGKKKWNRRVLKMIAVVESLLNYDVLYLGGGNARHLSVDLPRNVRTASNVNGITGGVHLWDDAIWHNLRGGNTQPAALPYRGRKQAPAAGLKGRMSA